ncbi:hypothetical protein M378DRAFT_75418 [Amanita muscaria Koide BX008]|uniref:UDENN domain-containing protein n=1 Tax=Amanita muscaria (strain Koide BX008) TaxID=946122 RepID=A0A0C2SS72_AMAMK|nr:hypothetical protein M378DRAFT_75418 [Amanita muscaria Koide BX008]
MPRVLAMSMLPDGAETQSDDWTIFFLNQTPFNTISPVLAEGSHGNKQDKRELLCVLNLVRTKKDKTLNRRVVHSSTYGAKVLALAICTRHPYIQIFKPFLLLALDDYFQDPSQDCLARLFDAVNSMDLSSAPRLTRYEKLVMRFSERKDIFAEKFSASITDQKHLHQQQISFDSSFTLGGSAVWVGDETDTSINRTDADGNLSRGSSSQVGSELGRKSVDASSSSSQAHGKESGQPTTVTHGHFDNQLRSAMTKDTHFYHTTVAYRDHQLPIKVPLSTFPEEVGDYSLISLIKVFASHQSVTGPQHPHLHTNGPQTHPIIILFNALITGKRIIFLGHKKPAGDVSSFVLAACALASGCGVVLRGFIERAFPYANLENRDEWENVPAYIAGVTNPIFETSRAWDLLFDISTGIVTVSKDIHIGYPLSSVPFIQPQALRSGTWKSEAPINNEDDGGRTSKETKIDGMGKLDYSADRNFIEDIRTAIEDHFGENLVRMRFTEYVLRFVRLASRYEEETTGTTKIGCPTSHFIEGGSEHPVQLGSGMFFNDEASCLRELNANAHRIQAWRATNSYRHCVTDFARQRASSAIQSIDVPYQVLRLKNSRNLPDAEVSSITRALTDNVKSYEQVIEFLADLVPFGGGGLVHLGFCLFHQRESVRVAAVELFNQLRTYPVGVLFLQTLNHFQRYAFVRQAHGRQQVGLLDGA